ncbi:hybrid sensory histidine kinase BarA [Rhabdaerophilaceae bacterium]
MIGLSLAGAASALPFIAGAVGAMALGLCVWLVFDHWRLRMELVRVDAARSALAETLQRIGRVQAEAEAANEAKTRFLATVSHEIRTPLNGVLGMADLMLDTRLDPEQANYARAIKTSGEALLTLIEEILDFSRIEAGKLEIGADSVELVPLVEGIVELLAPRAQDKGIEVAVHVAADVPSAILGDASRLRQIVTNLAGNAVKFTSAGGVGIRVFRQRQDQLVVCVEDTGPGIPQTRHEAIFAEFEQADSQTAARHGGTGLGLAISQRLARLMGGDIHLESSPGQGSRFTLLLPLLSVEAQPPAPSAALKEQSVLVVTAGPFEGHFIARHIAEAGARARHAGSIDEALAVLAQDCPDILVVDAAFGHDGARRIASAGHAAGCVRHLVLLSPFERRSFGVPQSAGFDRYLVKPVRRRSLLAQIADWEPGQGSSEKPESTEPQLSERLAGRRLLIAEDNDINALLAGRLIERLGGKPVRAATGLEALDLLHASRLPGALRFDAVLFDVRMPDLDGVAAIARWRAHELEAGLPPVPAIALTANAFREDREACLDAGFDAFLAKPLDREHFIATLDQLFGLGRVAA